MRDLSSGPPLETETVAGVAVPTTCRDRVDDEALARAVAALDEHGVTEYGVSPVGGLQIRLGVHRPEAVKTAIRTALSRVSDGVTDHGIANGFHRLRVDITDDSGTGPGSSQGE